MSAGEASTASRGVRLLDRRRAIPGRVVSRASTLSERFLRTVARAAAGRSGLLLTLFAVLGLVLGVHVLALPEVLATSEGGTSRTSGAVLSPEREVLAGVGAGPGQEQQARRRLLALGVGRYEEGDDFPPLRYAGADARTVASRFAAEGFEVSWAVAEADEVEDAEDPPGRFELPPDRDGVLASIDAFLGEVGRRDLAVFYFSGHGVRAAGTETGGEGPTTILCLPGTDPRALRETGLSMRELYSRFDACAAERVFVIVDACREAAKSGLSVDAAELPRPREGRFFLYSSAPGGRSFEPTSAREVDVRDRPMRNSVFTHYLLAVLEDRPRGRALTASGLFDRCSELLEQHGQRFPLELQVPHAHRSGGRIVLFDAAAPDPELEPVEARGPRTSRGTPPNGGREGSAVGKPDRRRPPEWVAEVLDWEPDPEVVADAAVRERLLATGLPWRVRTKEGALELLLVPPGRFRMAAEDPESALLGLRVETAEWTVRVREPFYLGRTEVTLADWRRVVPEVPAFPGVDGRYPLASATFAQMELFAQRTGTRLPRESEWEYACRAGGSARAPANLDAYAWNASNSNRAMQPVGTRRANAWGFHDMLGNAAEACSTRFAVVPATYLPDADELDSTAFDRLEGFGRIVRGGSTVDPVAALTPAWRGSSLPDRTFLTHVGFRVVRDP